MSSPSHRHRPRHRSDRGYHLLQTVAFTVGGIAGLASLIAICLVLPGGRTFLFIAAGILAVATLAVLSCMTGHLTAVIVNFFRLESGRANLELTLKRTRHGRPARHA